VASYFTFSPLSNSGVPCSFLAGKPPRTSLIGHPDQLTLAVLSCIGAFSTGDALTATGMEEATSCVFQHLNNKHHHTLTVTTHIIYCQKMSNSDWAWQENHTL